MISKNGVCYDIRESPYTFTWRGICYFFSSENHVRKFKNEVREREKWLNDSLSRRFRCTVDLPVLADIQLYTRVETRGFYLQTEDGADYTHPAEVCVMADMLRLGVVDGTL